MINKEIEMGDTIEQTRDHASVDIRDADELLAISMEAKLCYDSPLSARCSIFRVPNILRRHNEKAYEPDIVSIGPFHRSKTSLQAIEKVKRWYLQALLSRVGPTLNISLKSLIKGIREFEKRARDCYAEPIDLDTDEFVEMMIVDGCFIIELFRKDVEEVPRDKDDPIFNMPCMHENLFHDLLLLENQIPWSVLQCLFNLTMGSENRNTSLVELVIKFFGDLFSTTPNSKASFMYESLHILDLIRNMLISPFGHKETNHVENWELIPCVTNLLEAGVKFKKGSPDSILDIEFIHGVLVIPPLLIQEVTEPVFRNLIAFEQCYHGCLDKITSYAILMDSLINSSKDVDFLHQNGILRNWLSAEDASQFFNRLYNDTFVTKFYYGGLCEQVNDYYRTDWHKWRATLKRNYFNTPWATISVIAAIILLLLTFLQTLFSIIH